jgi:hypothetical protein
MYLVSLSGKQQPGRIFMTPTRGGIAKWQQWAGRALRALVTLVFLVSGGAKLAHVPKVVSELTRAGIPENAILPIGILELTCLALYWFPRTSILGTFLFVGYLGGAIATHIIARENFAPPFVVGTWMFASAYLRYPELRRLVPFRPAKSPAETPEPYLRSQPTRG